MGPRDTYMYDDEAEEGNFDLQVNTDYTDGCELYSTLETNNSKCMYHIQQI